LVHAFEALRKKDVDARDFCANARKTRFALLHGHDELCAGGSAGFDFLERILRYVRLDFWLASAKHACAVTSPRKRQEREKQHHRAPGDGRRV